MTTPDDLLALAEDGVRRARQAGADEAEVYFWSARGHHAKLGGTLSNVERTDTSGLSVRTFVDGRDAFAVSSGISPLDLAWAIDRAVRSAGLAPRTGRRAGLPSTAATPRPPTGVDPRLLDPAPDRLMSVVDVLGEVAATAPSVDYAEATVGSHYGLFAVANSAGVATWDHNAYENCVFEVRSRGDVPKFAKTGAFGRHPVDECEDLAALARDIVELAGSSTGATRLDRPVQRVIFDAVAAKEILHRVLASFNGQAVHEGRSRLKGRIGERIAHEGLTIRDRPNDGAGCRNQRVDDEGVPTRDTTLIEAGVATSFVYDWRASVEAGVPPTGNGFRSIDNRYADRPSPQTVNVEVAPGDRTLEEIVEGADRAVLVRGGVLGSFTMNPFLGDFSFVVPMAHYVEGGKIRHAVTSGTAGGNLFDALRHIEHIGRDVRRLVAGTSVPLAVGGVTFAT